VSGVEVLVVGSASGSSSPASSVGRFIARRAACRAFWMLTARRSRRRWRKLLRSPRVAGGGSLLLWPLLDEIMSRIFWWKAAGSLTSENSRSPDSSLADSMKIVA